MDIKYTWESNSCVQHCDAAQTCIFKHLEHILGTDILSNQITPILQLIMSLLWRHISVTASQIVGSETVLLINGLFGLTKKNINGLHDLYQYWFVVNTLRPRQNGRHFADDIFKCIFLNENEWSLFMISLKFVPKVRINNIPALV